MRQDGRGTMVNDLLRRMTLFELCKLEQRRQDLLEVTWEGGLCSNSAFSSQIYEDYCNLPVRITRQTRAGHSYQGCRYALVILSLSPDMSNTWMDTALTNHFEIQHPKSDCLRATPSDRHLSARVSSPSVVFSAY